MANTTPTLIKRIEQTELNEVCNLVTECYVLPTDLMRVLLRKRGKNENQIEAILNQLVKRKMAFYDETRTYLKANKSFSAANMSAGQVKAIWILMDLIKNIDEYFVQTKAPHVLTFFNSNAEKDGLSPIYDLFYIPYDSEKLNEYIVNNMANQSEEGINAFIIVDSKEQIDRFNFSDKVNIISFVTVSADGKIEYINE